MDEKRASEGEHRGDPLSQFIGCIADSIFAGEPPSDEDIALLRANAAELSFDNGEFWTHVLPRDSNILEKPQNRLNWDFLEDVISEDRLEQLAAGQEPTAEEIGLLRDVLIEALFQRPDDDITPGLWTLDLQGSVGSAVAIVACEGHSFSGVRRSLLGTYRDLDEARSCLSEAYIFPG
ncbi:hypothetical protein [Microvirga arabica]|uniref:hypothetical protein n=1 Tax=Microvirga arabica TaxID=1128671 RepID=UPI00193A13F6|nr:hypothetical protein [Microvirga arabica]MBM1169930.1 hypothetical protein [Microvirga arabica]